MRHRCCDDDEIRQIVGQVLADYFNGGAAYGRFTADDFDFDPGDFDLN